MFAIIYDKDTKQIKKSIAGIKSKNDITFATNEDCILTDKPPRTITKFHKVIDDKIVFDKVQYQNSLQTKLEKQQLIEQLNKKKQELQKKREEALDKLISMSLATISVDIENLKQQISQLEGELDGYRNKSK